MTSLLAHRGPDGTAVESPSGEPFAFGHRRLAIIDLSAAANQPMWDASGRYCVTYNGEIYNYRDLRHELEAAGYAFRSTSDTEVLLAAYAAWGPRCLDRFNGMFALAIWDRTKEELFVARDRLGIKPLYWASHSEGLVFASEIKAILATGLVEIKADPQSIHNPWHYPSSPRTGFVGIHKLPPAHTLTWQSGHVVLKPWWSIPAPSRPLSRSEAYDRLTSLLMDSVRLEMISDVPVGALLSGGLDSSTIVALMSRQSTGKIRTIAVRFRREDVPFEAMPDDERFARSVAERFGCEHTEIEISPQVVDLLPKMVWHLDEPVFDPAAINTMLIAAEARRRGIKVLLSGMGGDEIFGGYRKHLACLLAERYQRFVPAAVRSVVESGAHWLPVATSQGGLRQIRWLRRFLGFASLPPNERFLLSDLSLSPADHADIFASSGAMPYEQLDEVVARCQLLQGSPSSYLDRMCRSDTAMYLPDHNLTYTDKATMSAGVEARPPLIDHRVVELAFQLTDAERIRGRVQKALFREVARQWIPKAIANRPKANFAAPLRAWIRRDLAEMVDDLLSESAIRRRGLYNPQAVRRRIEDDRKGRADHAHLIWNLLNRELWFEAFIDNGGKALSAARGSLAMA